MEYSALQAFVVVAQLENITKASDMLHISQSALSNIIDKLEIELGQPLFERYGKKLRLNDNGRLLAETSKKILENYSYGIRVMRDSKTVSGTIKIGVLAENDGLFYLLANFRKIHPQIRIDLTNEKASIEDFLASDIDFFVLPSNLKGDLPSAKIAMRGKLFVLMSSDHPLASKRVLSFDDIRQERFAFAISENGKIEPVYRRCVNEGFKPNVSFLYTDIKYQLEIVLQSGAITIAYNTFRQFRQNMDGIVAVPLLCNDNFTTDIVLAWRKKPTNPVAKLLAEYAVGYNFERLSYL
jgi:DNA-binding transcriptional LysR family regulator